MVQTSYSSYRHANDTSLTAHVYRDVRQNRECSQKTGVTEYGIPYSRYPRVKNPRIFGTPVQHFRRIYGLSNALGNLEPPACYTKHSMDTALYGEKRDEKCTKENFSHFLTKLKCGYRSKHLPYREIELFVPA